MSDAIDRFRASLSKNPEQSYNHFVTKWNSLSVAIEEISVIVSFLSNELGAESIAARRILLGTSDESIPSWSDLVEARLACDLDDLDMFVTQKGSDQTAVFSLKLNKNLSSWKKIASQGTVKEFLESTFRATLRTLPAHEQPEGDKSIVFQGRSLAFFFGVNDSSTSTKMIQEQIRHYNFSTRKVMVRSLVSTCNLRRKWQITTKFLSVVMPENNRKSKTTNRQGPQHRQSKVARTVVPIDFDAGANEVDSQSQQGNTDNRVNEPSRQLTLRDYVETDNRFVSEMQNIYSDESTFQLIRLSVPDNEQPIVFAIDQFFEEDFRQKILKNLDLSIFMRGLGGRSSSFVRIAVANNQLSTYFQIGSNLYPAVRMDQHEQDILARVNSIIDLQNSLYPPAIRNSVWSQHVNTLQIIVEYVGEKSGYGLHSDFGRLLNAHGDLSEYDSSMVLPEDRLPYREEMQTFTIVLTTCADSSRNTHTLSFYSSDQNKCLASVKTSGNMLHAQLHGSQMFQHRVDRVREDMDERHVVRIVLSARYTIPSDNEKLSRVFGTRYGNLIVDKERYTHRNILSLLRSGTNIPRNTRTTTDQHSDNYLDEQPPNTTPIDDAKWKLSDRSLFKDTWKQCSYDRFLSFDLHRNPSKLKVQDIDRWKFFSSAHVVRSMLLSYGLIPTTVFSNKKSMSRSVLPAIYTREFGTPSKTTRMLLPLDAIQTESLTSFGFTTHTKRSHPPCPSDHEVTNMVLGYHPYKNDVKSISLYVDVILNLINPNRDPLYGEQTNEIVQKKAIPGISIFGSGGAAQNIDAHSMPLKSVNKMMAGSTVPTPQVVEGNYHNRTFHNLCERQAAVAVFINLEEFEPYLPPDTIACLGLGDVWQTSSLFLGYFYFLNYTREYLTPAELRLNIDEVLRHTHGLDGKQRGKFVDFSSFRKQYYLSFPLTPLFHDWDEYRLVNIRNCTGGFVHYQFSDTDERPVAANIDDAADIEDSYPNEFFIHQFLSEIADELNEHYEEGIGGDSDFNNIMGHQMSEFDLVKKGTTISDRHDIFRHVLMLMVAGCRRYLQENIIESEHVACPLSVESILSSIYRGGPMPMPFRTYDVITLMLRACALFLGILPSDEYRVRASASLFSSDFLFMSILNRLTGRPRVYLLFHEHFPQCCSSIIPGPDQLDDFLSFIMANACHKLLFNPQHINSIPLDLRLHEHVFCAVFRDLARHAPAIFQGLKSADITSRKDAVAYLSKKLKIRIEEHKTHLNERSFSDSKYLWLAHQVISDLEEIFVDPFGAVTPDSVSYGPGAIQGWYVCFAELDDLTGIQLYRESRYPTELLKWIIDQVNRVSSTRSRIYRRILGLDLEEGTGKVVVALNGRALCESDIEHILCKVYIGVTKTLSSRSSSTMPIASKPGYHPTNVGDSLNIPWDDNVVSSIFEESVNSYQCAIERDLITQTPDCFLIRDEVDPFERKQCASSESG